MDEKRSGTVGNIYRDGIGAVRTGLRENDGDKVRSGVQVLADAVKAGNAAAHCYLAACLRDRLPGTEDLRSDSTYIRSLFYYGVRKKVLHADEALESFCAREYSGLMEKRGIRPVHFSHLIDHKGRYIEIHRSSRLCPVQAELTSEDGVHTLTLTVRLRFLIPDEIERDGEFMDRICEGIGAWSGTYEVFGGQELHVRVRIDESRGCGAKLWVLPVPDELREMIVELLKGLPGKNIKRAMGLLRDKRSYALFSTVLWKVFAPKMIVMLKTADNTKDLNELSWVATHEFGHILGIGDLYADPESKLMGVEPGSFGELDCYALGNKRFYSVMCMHNAPIRNNDMEMVLLALTENRYQRYQKDKLGKRISPALGRGN